MIISQSFLDTLSARAKANPRLRQAYDLRNSENDNSQRMLNRLRERTQRSSLLEAMLSREEVNEVNALEMGTVMPIHRHRNTSESIAILRGKMIMRLYDDNGRVAEEYVMMPGGQYPMIQVEAGQWHSLEVLEEGTVMFESMDGRYEAVREGDVSGKWQWSNTGN